jgi:hypothetical protein
MIGVLTNILIFLKGIIYVIGHNDLKISDKKVKYISLKTFFSGSIKVFYSEFTVKIFLIQIVLIEISKIMLSIFNSGYNSW